MPELTNRLSSAEECEAATSYDSPASRKRITDTSKIMKDLALRYFLLCRGVDPWIGRVGLYDLVRACALDG